MNEENKQLLNEVQKVRLEKVLNGTDEDGTAFKEAMQITDKLNDMDKTENSYREQIEKLEAEHAVQMEKLEAEHQDTVLKLEAEEKQHKKEFKRNLILTALTSVGAPLLVMTAKFFMGRSNQKLIGEIEQYETPVTTPGKSQHKNMIDDYRL